MLNSTGFNSWADEYDKSVNLSEKCNQYPFAGYRDVLNNIYNQIICEKKGDVLDIGFGTGVLTSQLYNEGCKITGIDFSNKMIEIAKKKMPNALLVQGDFSKEIPSEIKKSKYDYIISTYAIHHLSDSQKVNFIDEAASLLKPSGKILFGDVSFETREELEKCKRDFKDYWDYDEIYFVYSEIKEKLKYKYSCNYKKISFCAGVLIVSLKK